MSEGVETKRRRTWTWPVAVIAMLVAHITLWLVFVSIAARDPSFSVEPDYYQKALRWDDTAAQLRLNHELGWSVEIETDPQTGPLGDRRMTCRVLDHDAHPVVGAKVDLVTFHHARAAERIEVGLAEESPGMYSARPRMVRPGLWECRLTVRTGTTTFTHVEVRSVGGVTWRH